MLSDENRIFWLAVNRVFGSNLRAIALLRERFASIEEVFRARPQALTAMGLEEDRARELLAPGMLDFIRREIERLKKRGVTPLIYGEKRYPSRLREIYDPPAVLYCAGDPAVLDRPAVAMVGSRKPTAYGRAVAERLGEDLAGCGLTVISGLARGIDSASHWGALKGGRTVAVLGSGLERVYPRENTRLFDRVVESGAVVSELPPEAPPLGFHFPMRNRLISGLTLALVVVEAARRSGSLISARLALEQNREVMAVPGNVTSELSAGTNWLIGNGAKPVSGWRDVVEELSPEVRAGLREKPPVRRTQVPLDPREKRVLALLEPDSERHIDDIVEAGGLAVSEALSILLALELKGLAAQRPGKFFQRKW
jgi:DNA processing protein